jgi:hypothetical protein
MNHTSQLYLVGTYANQIHNPLFPGKIILPPILNMATNPITAGDLKFAVQDSRR